VGANKYSKICAPTNIPKSVPFEVSGPAAMTRCNDPGEILCGREYIIGSFFHAEFPADWPVRKENEVAFQRAEIRLVRWMCDVKVKDKVPNKELRERLGIDDVVLVLQQNSLRWYGHVLRKEDTDLVKNCMEYEVHGSRPGGRPKRTWRDVVQKDCQARKSNGTMLCIVVDGGS